LLKITVQARHGGTHLESQLIGRQRLERLWFRASPGKKLGKPHINK
jgi:hypothetical protein